MGEDPSGAPRRGPWVVAVVAIVAIVLSGVGAVLVAKGQSEGDDVASDEPGPGQADDAVLAPGAPIIEGFVVAPGTTVAGGAFPSPGGSSDGQPVEAWGFVVTAGADLPGAFAAYVEQARALGFSGLGDPAVACAVNPAAPTAGDDGVLVDPAPDAPPRSLQCAAFGQRIVDDRAEQLYLSAERTYGAEYPADEMVVAFDRWPAGADVGDLSDLGPTDPEAGAEATLPPGVSPAASGWRAGADDVPTVSTLPPSGISPDCGPALAPVAGAAPIGAAISCGLRYSLVYEVTGDASAVFDDHARQIREFSGFNEPSYTFEQLEFDGRSGTYAGIWGDDSTSLQLTLLDARDGRPAVLRIDYVNGT